MRARELGQSGIWVSEVGLGCNNFGFFQDASQATKCVSQALDAGISFFDMASEHGCGREEELVGAALGSGRKNVVIATKFGQPELIGLTSDGKMNFSADVHRQGLARKWIVRSAEESLKRLNSDYIDVYQPHVRSEPYQLEEMLRALDDLIRAGKVRAIGSAVNAGSVSDVELQQQFAKLHGLTQLVSMQAEYNLLNREAEGEIIPMLKRNGMSLLPYWPLANGLLTGKYRAPAALPSGSRLAKISGLRGLYRKHHWKAIEELRVIAEDVGISMLDLSISWLLSKDVVASVIAGATSPEQIVQNVKAADYRLDPEHMSKLDRILS